MIYLASPYTHERADIRNLRYRQTLIYTQHCMTKGEIIFSPIVYGHPFVEFGESAIYHAYWQTFNEEILLACSELRVLKLEGWLTSRGVRAEVDYAERMGIEVRTVEPIT